MGAEFLSTRFIAFRRNVFLPDRKQIYRVIKIDKMPERQLVSFDEKRNPLVVFFRGFA